MDVEESGHSLSEVLSQHLFEGMEESQQKTCHLE
jgi:hypothetical protein